MTDLVLAPGTDVVPDGWWEAVVMPWADEQTDDGSLRDTAARLDGLAAAYRTLNADTLELVKARRYLEVRWGELLGEGKRGRPVNAVASAFTVERHERAAFRQLAASRIRVVEAIRAATDGDQISRAALLKEAHKAKRRAVEHTPAIQDLAVLDETGHGFTLAHGDFRDRLDALDDDSVDLIVTDPPYPKEDLPLWSDLAEVAARILKPRGILFAWTGQLFLPEVLNRCGEHLNYGWTFALMLPGGNSRIMGRHIIQAWKPIVAFTPGTWPSGEWGADVLASPVEEKTDYEWQQSVAPAVRLIERYCPPNGVVVDPFMGVGSFGIAAREVERRFIGVELDAERFKRACKRLQ